MIRDLDLCPECRIEYIYGDQRICFHCRITREMDERARQMGRPTLEEANAARLQEGPAGMIPCARCARPIQAKTAEVCCWCSRAVLCGACWDEFGHCGHIQADLVNMVGRLNLCRRSVGLMPMPYPLRREVSAL